jgi:hypothetical protein
MGAQAFVCASFIGVDVVHLLLVSAFPHHIPGTPMKTARFLLACAVASVLAACGTDPITAPAAAPKPPAADETSCVKTTVVTANGTTTEVCAETVTGSQMGSGY